jgi:hypothetical protein
MYRKTYFRNGHNLNPDHLMCIRAQYIFLSCNTFPFYVLIKLGSTFIRNLTKRFVTKHTVVITLN